MRLFTQGAAPTAEEAEYSEVPEDDKPKEDENEKKKSKISEVKEEDKKEDPEAKQKLEDIADEEKNKSGKLSIA